MGDPQTRDPAAFRFRRIRWRAGDTDSAMGSSAFVSTRWRLYGFRTKNHLVLERSRGRLCPAGIWQACAILSIDLFAALLFDHPQSHQVHAPISSLCAYSLWIRPGGSGAALS